MDFLQASLVDPPKNKNQAPILQLIALTIENIDKMKREILAVVNRYVNGVNVEDVDIKQRSDANADILEMNVNLPDDHSTPHR